MSDRTDVLRVPRIDRAMLQTGNDSQHPATQSRFARQRGDSCVVDALQLPASGEDDDMDVGEIAELHEIVEDDFEVGCLIKEMLVPHAVSWFTGEMMDEQESDEDDEDDDEDDEDDDDFDSDDDEGDEV